MNPYTVKHHRAAATERNWLCETYGQSFRSGYARWMDELADRSAEVRGDANAFDLEEWLGAIEQQTFDAIQNKSLANWARSLKKFRQAPYLEKLRALLAVVRNRRPPWQLKGSHRAIMALDGQLAINVGLVFELNDAARLVVVRQVLHQAI